MTIFLFEFTGGCLDGQTLECQPSADKLVGDGSSYYILTDEGKVGTRFSTISPAARELIVTGNARAAAPKGFPMHTYEVKDRMERGGKVLVRCQFMEVSSRNR
jgi:hypothetical protein